MRIQVRTRSGQCVVCFLVAIATTACQESVDLEANVVNSRPDPQRLQETGQDGIEWPEGELECVAQFDCLDPSGAGKRIVEGLLKEDILPSIFGSRGINVNVSSESAEKARQIIAQLIEEHDLEVVIVR